MILLHAERLPVGEVQDHPDDSGHKAEHQAPKRTLNKIVKKMIKGIVKTTMLKIIQDIKKFQNQLIGLKMPSTIGGR